MTQGKAKCGTVNKVKPTHHGIGLFRVELAAQQVGAEHGHERYGNDGRADHREGLCKRQRMEKLAFLTR